MELLYVLLHKWNVKLKEVCDVIELGLVASLQLMSDCQYVTIFSRHLVNWLIDLIDMF